MKFNEELLKDLLQNEPTEWNSDDLSWFDDALYLKFKNKQLSQTENDKIIDMMAHDQTVLNHYLHLKQHIKSGRKASGFWSRYQWVMASLFMVTAATLIWVNQVEVQTSGLGDISRGASETMVHPVRNAELESLPAYFVVPQFQQLVRVELLIDKEIVWQSEWQQSQRFLLPMSVRDGLFSGEYHWHVVTQTLDQVYTSGFTLLD